MWHDTRILETLLLIDKYVDGYELLEVEWRNIMIPDVALGSRRSFIMLSQKGSCMDRSV